MNSNVIIKTKQSRKRLTAAFTILAMLAAFVFIPGVTLAESDDIPVMLKAEVSISETNTLEVKQTKSVKVANLYDAVSGDDKIATVSFIKGSSNDNLSVTGVKAGVVSVAYGTTNGVSGTRKYQITDSSNISEFTLTGGGKVYFDKAKETKPTPMSVTPGKGNINTVTWKSHDTSVATVDSKSGAITAVDDGVTTILGEFNDKWGTPRIVKVVALVGHSEDNSLGGGGIVDKGNIGQGGDGNWYRPVGKPPHVFEVVDEDGKSMEPPQYVYNTGDNPGGGNDKVAEKDGNNYYVENPDNIWTPIGPDGNLNEDGAIWGGPNGKPGGGDDMPVVNFNGDHWVDMGQNVWKKVKKEDTSTPGFELGPLTGGGPDMNPATEPVYNIFDNTAGDGRYYIGPLGPDVEGYEYFYGDSNLYDRNGTLDSTAEYLWDDDMVYYRDNNGKMVTKRPEKDMSEAPTLVGNNLIAPSFTGDTVDWIEIARNGNYSLIVRTKYINIHELAIHYDDLAWQTPGYGKNNQYADSLVRLYINNWFEGKAKGAADNLRKDARLRKFTMQNTAPEMLGTSSESSTDSLVNGFSAPTTVQIPSGSTNVAFALSYGEVSNFLSLKHNVIADVVDSDPNAVGNYNAMIANMPAGSEGILKDYGMWLRTPGTTGGTELKPLYFAAILGFNGGRAFQSNVDNDATGATKGLIYPALWVKTALLEDKTMYKAVEGKKNIYELLNEFGTPKTYPSSYIYSTDEKPATGTRLPAVYDGKSCYVELEEGSNIWVYVNTDGSLDLTVLTWGGPSGKPGGTGEKQATKFGDSYWITVGQNIWQKITGKNLGPLMAGGPNENPAEAQESKVQESGGNYYIGPIPPKNGIDIVHYYGAKSNGYKVTSTSAAMATTDMVYYYDNGMMFASKPAGGCTTMGEGRILDGFKIGDATSDWIELAKNGQYALIVRKEAIKWMTGTDAMQFSITGTGNSYSASSVRTSVNYWFTGTNDKGGDNLQSGAKLREFTMGNTSSANIGAFNNSVDGFSKPSDTAMSNGADVAFLLSYSEVARYLSKIDATNTGAIGNFGRFEMKTGEKMWLRSPNPSLTSSVGILESAGSANVMESTMTGTMHPALWVKSSIFDL